MHWLTSFYLNILYHFRLSYLFSVHVGLKLKLDPERDNIVKLSKNIRQRSGSRHITTAVLTQNYIVSMTYYNYRLCYIKQPLTEIDVDESSELFRFPRLYLGNQYALWISYVNDITSVKWMLLNVGIWYIELQIYGQWWYWYLENRVADDNIIMIHT